MTRKPPMWGYRERPEMVWLITLGYFIGIGFATFLIVMAFLGRLPMTPAGQELWSSYGVFYWCVRAAVVAGKLIGTVLLWWGRRQALHFYVGAFVLDLAQLAYAAATRGRQLVDVLEAPGMYWMVVDLGLSLVVIGYVYHLSRKKWDE